MPFRKVSRCHEDFVKIIYKVSEILQLSDVEYYIEFGCEDVDSFLNGIFRVQFKGYQDGIKVKKTAVIKWHPEEKMRKKLRDFYHREFVFYYYVVPAFLDIQRHFVIEGLKMKFSNCLFASNEMNKETMVLYSFNTGYYKMLDRMHKTDLAHATLVVKNLAKLHALSFALERLESGKFEEIRKLYNKEVQYSNMDRAPVAMENYFLTSVNVVQNETAREKLKGIANNLVQVLQTCAMPASHSVICHADCWNNNIVVKYQRGKPVDVILIDYQLSRLASPATDLSYFFYMCTGKELLDEHYDYILNSYYGTLSGVLKCCNLDVSEIYPRDIFEKHLKDYSALGLIEALVSMKILTANFEEAFEIAELKLNITDNNICEEVIQNQCLFQERVNGVVEHFFTRGYSLDAVIQKCI